MRARPGTRSTATSLWGSNAIACASSSSPPSSFTVVSSSPATTWAFVTTIPGAGHPAGTLHGETACHARAPAPRCPALPCTSASRRMRRLGGGTSAPGRRSAETGRRAPARSGWGPTAAAPRSASAGWPSAGCPCGSSRAPGVCSATAPGDPDQRPGRASRPAAAPPMPSSTSAAAERQPAPDALSHRLEQRSPRAPPTISARHEAEERRVRRAAIPGRAAAGRAGCRRTRRPRSPASDRRAHDQALRVAPQRHQGDERDDDPVDRGHAAPILRASCALCIYRVALHGGTQRLRLATTHGVTRPRSGSRAWALLIASLGALLVVFNPFGLAVAGLVLAVRRSGARRAWRAWAHWYWVLAGGAAWWSCRA